MTRMGESQKSQLEILHRHLLTYFMLAINLKTYFLLFEIYSKAIQTASPDHDKSQASMTTISEYWEDSRRLRNFPKKINSCKVVSRMNRNHKSELREPWAKPNQDRKEFCSWTSSRSALRKLCFNEQKAVINYARKTLRRFNVCEVATPLTSLRCQKVLLILQRFHLGSLQGLCSSSPDELQLGPRNLIIEKLSSPSRKLIGWRRWRSESGYIGFEIIKFSQ